MNLKKFFYRISQFNSKKDYYAVLNIAKTEDQGAIKKAYYQLAKKYHPDVNNGNDAKFKEVSEAYEVLSDAANKRSYDESRNQPRQEQQQTYSQQQSQYYYQQKPQANTWNNRSGFEQAQRARSQQSQQQNYQYPNAESKRAAEEMMNAFLKRAAQYNSNRMHWEQHMRRQYEEEQKQEQIRQREREAYEYYRQQREYEEMINQKAQQYKEQFRNVSQKMEQIQKNWNTIKDTASKIWKTLNGDKK